MKSSPWKIVFFSETVDLILRVWKHVLHGLTSIFWVFSAHHWWFSHWFYIWIWVIIVIHWSYNAHTAPPTRLVVLVHHCYLDKSWVLGSLILQCLWPIATLRLGWFTHNCPPHCLFSLGVVLSLMYMKTITVDWAKGVGDENDNSKSCNFTGFNQPFLVRMMIQVRMAIWAPSMGTARQVESSK